MTRLAVLPLENERNDPAATFFIDGMHDALISEMGQAGLEVIGRRSVIRYRDDATPVRDIARDLNVDAVVEGFAFRDADSVGIRVRLVDGASETGLWSATFGADVRNVIRLYRRVTAAIAEAIELPLTPEAARRLASAPAVDPAAYEAYLNGMYHYHRLTPQDIELAEQYFQRALDIDPNYALAYQGMADVWLGRQQFGLTPPEEAAPRARAAAEQALAADSTVSETHYTLAVLRTWTEWDWLGADEAFRAALALNPSYAEARAFYAHLLLFLGRRADAVEQANRAVGTDPASPLIAALSCVTLSYAGAFEDAMATCDEALRRDPAQPVAWDGRGNALLSAGRRDEFLANEITRARAAGDEEWARTLERGNEEGGYRRAMGLAAQLLVARSDTTYVPPSWIGDTFAEAGEMENALDWMERGVDVRDPGMPYLVVADWPEEIATDARFRSLVQRMGLPLPNR